MKDYQHALPTLSEGMSAPEAVLLDRKVKEWTDKGYQVLFARLDGGVGCLLYRPKETPGPQTLHKLNDYRGQGENPLKALQAAAAQLGSEALFG